MEFKLSPILRKIGPISLPQGVHEAWEQLDRQVTNSLRQEEARSAEIETLRTRVEDKVLQIIRKEFQADSE